MQTSLSEVGAWCAQEDLAELSVNVQKSTDCFVSLLKESHDLEGNLENVQAMYLKFVGLIEQIRAFLGIKENFLKTLNIDYRLLESVDLKEDRLSQFEVRLPITLLTRKL